MTLFANPKRIEVLSAANWDFHLQDVLLHARGAGNPLPEPEVRYWEFPNGLGVMTRLSRDMLLAGHVYYDAWVMQLHAEGPPRFLGERDLRARKLPDTFAPQENLPLDEVEEFLKTVSTYPKGGVTQ